MLAVVSLLMVFAYSIYIFIISKSNSQNGNKLLAKCIPMILGMTSSVTIGLMIAILFPKMLAVSTILSIVLSAVVAFAIGKGFGLSGILEAQSASFMGSMMGAMLGVMLSANETTMMIVAMDFIYMSSMYSTRVFLHKDSNIKRALFNTSPFFYLTIILSICAIAVVTFLQIDRSMIVEVETSIQHTHQH